MVMTQHMFSNIVSNLKIPEYTKSNPLSGNMKKSIKIYCEI